MRRNLGHHGAMRLILRLAPVVIVASVFLGVASNAWASTITGYSPTSGASVAGPRPTFSISAANLNSAGQSFFLQVTDTNNAVGGELFGGMLLSIPAEGGSVQPYLDLAPGTYYYQWQYNDYGCFTMTRITTGIEYYQPDCHPDPLTSCPLFANGRCTGAVLSFTVTAPAPPPPPPPVPPTGGSGVTTTDTTAPLIKALSASALLGVPVRLKFQVSDNSGSAAVSVGVYRGKNQLMRRDYSLQPVRGVYYTTWKPTRRGSLSFCVIASDGAGNQSSASCARLSVR